VEGLSGGCEGEEGEGDKEEEEEEEEVGRSGRAVDGARNSGVVVLCGA